MSWVNAQQSNMQQQAAFNPVFGNTSFMVTAPQKGEVMHGFPEIAYFSLEAIAQQQQMNPNNIRSGNTTGTQNINGAYTIQDASGSTRMLMGYQPGAF
jgi:hypothetical protein